jgi:hypothetical protein
VVAAARAEQDEEKKGDELGAVFHGMSVGFWADSNYPAKLCLPARLHHTMILVYYYVTAC